MNAAGLAETAKLIKAQSPHVGTLEVVVNVTEEQSVNQMVDQAVAAFGTLDCAANAAGVIVNHRAKTADYPIDEYDRVMAINGRGVALCMSAEARVMLKQPRKLTSTAWQDERRAQVGSIVNFSSVCGFVCMPDVMPYNAAKHAVMGMTRSAAIEHGPQGLRVNAVCPGIVDTPFIESLKKKVGGESSPVFANPLGRLCYPDEIADACVYLSSTMSSYVNGLALVSDGGKTCQY
ncbi:hypothetical protein BDY17DRAFT_191053 [Neohortaea acidophila]|uniref:Uncharacterized protein n=1 Tax=Neohortaea acidophila TaxID=245834 RepID=A0A6A6PQR1_9PEZI|nr:uncharacterized protein BDY17DRAFT_191053 [Neohortaea acidophila]KAF2481577.1 hypothetical protein BDY17DRAFT_191053 [Neohortaea acidophila]